MEEQKGSLPQSTSDSVGSRGQAYRQAYTPRDLERLHPIPEYLHQTHPTDPRDWSDSWLLHIRHLHL